MNGAMIEQNPFMLSLSKHSSLLFNSLSKFETNLRLDFGFRASDFFAVRPSAKADISLTQSHLRAPEPLAVNIDEIVVRGYWTLVQYGSFVVQPFSTADSHRISDAHGWDGLERSRLSTAWTRCARMALSASCRVSKI
jgi:hypothetical protein